MSSGPVFFDPSGTRRVHLKRTFWVVATLASAVGTLFVLSLLSIPFLSSTGEPATLRLRHLLPSIPARTQRISLLLLNRERDSLWKEIARSNVRSQATLAAASPTTGPGNRAIGRSRGATAPIVAAFYAPWQRSGLASFRAEASHLTHVLPVWLQLDSSGSGLAFAGYDKAEAERVKDVARAHGVAVCPLLANSFDGTFDGARVGRLLDSATTQRTFIHRLTAWLLANNFQGINLDFENLSAADYMRMPAFTRSLADALHRNGLSLSLDIEAQHLASAPAMAAPCDFVVLMCYDQHNAAGPAGPIASWSWSAHLVDAALKILPAHKVVMGIGNYSLDWTDDSHQPADPMTYQAALLNARDAAENSPPQRAVDFDSDALNATYEYSDDDGHHHQVWMLDAASAYNQWKLSTGAGLRGEALWMLGSEDPAVWTFLRRDNVAANVHPAQMEKVQFPFGEPQFIGNGEILKVVSSPQIGHRSLDFDATTGLCTDQEYDRFPSSYVIKRSGYSKNALALTFDDGPDPTWTPQILDTLKKYHLHATFFELGQCAEMYPDLVRRVYREGHDIGSHSFTHPNLGLVSARRVELELNATQRSIQSLLGHSTRLFRPPYNADAEPRTSEEVRPVLQATQMGYLTVGEFIDPEDWNPLIQVAPNQVRPRTVADIVRDVEAGTALKRGNVILMHDAGGDRDKTVEALQILIPALQKRGFHFVSIDKLLHVPRSTLMPALTGNQLLYARFDRNVFNVIFGTEWLLRVAFLLAIFCGIGRIVFIVPLVIAAHLRERRLRFDPAYVPFVSVLIAAYNEEAVVVRTIASILAADYPQLEVIVVDDGSSDGTAAAVAAAYANESRVHLLKQVNGGKAAALNLALAVARGEVCVGFDADTQVAPGAIGLLVRHFSNPRIGAVAGNVKVGNRLNILTCWQAIEYVTTQNLDRRAYGLLNAISVVPGAIGAWRRSAIEQVGGYQADTLAEDMDLTWRLLRAGWRIGNENAACAYTEAPDSMSTLYKQRFRWAYGTLQCLAKHRRAIGRCGWFGAVTLPGIAIFQFALQWLAPCVDLQMGYALSSTALSWLHSGLYSGQWHADATTILFLQKTGFYYGLFFAAELTGAALAVRLDHEKPGLLWWLFWQRFVYRQMLYAVIWKASLTALGGLRQGWGKLARKGTVSLPAAPRPL